MISTFPTWQSAPPSSFRARAVVVIDVLRWSTVVATSLAHGASRVEAFADPEETLDRARELGRADVAVGGERGNRALPGFDVGNSPLEYTPERVGGRVVLSTTTNGTAALLAAREAAATYVAAFVNLGAVTRAMRAELTRGREVVLLAAGQGGAEALEDTACAGALAEALRDLAPADVATQRAVELWRAHARDATRVIAAAPHSASLRETGHEPDLAACARRDALDIVPRAQGRSITRGAP